MYWQYFTQNRYKFYNSTKTENKVDSNDFRTWDLNTLFEEIHTHFNASLKNSDNLQKVKFMSFLIFYKFKKILKNTDQPYLIF